MANTHLMYIFKMRKSNESTMQISYSCTLEVEFGSNLTTSLSDAHWKHLSEKHISCWDVASNIFKSIEYKKKGVVVTADWGDIIKNINQYSLAMEKFQCSKSSGLKYEQIVLEFPKENPVVKFGLNYRDGIENVGIHNYSRSIIEYTLFNIFIIMNISSPASIDMYGAKFKSDVEALNLSNYLFDVAMLNSLDGGWPSIKCVDLEKTQKWFKHSISDFGQVPDNKMEKILFSIMHLCKSSISPLNIIWIFYALETIFDTKPGENFRYLIYRIELLLNPSEGELKFLKKMLRKLYDIRSSLVHGGLQIIHPLNNEILDDRVDDKSLEFLLATDFGFQLILSCIQEFILRGWSEAEFKEIIQGKCM